MADNIVNTYNLYLDSDRGLTAGSQGDSFILNLNSAGVSCAAGQYIRLTLNNFSMYKSFTDINANNSTFRVRVTGQDADVNLSHRNNSTVNALATDFATQLAAQLLTFAQAVTPTPSTAVATQISNLTPDTATTINGNTNNVISFRITFVDGATPTPNPVAHLLTNTIVQCFTDVGDSYAVLGADRINDITNTTTSSITINDSNANYIDVTCLYPAQRSSCSYIYLRTDLLNTSLETIGLSHPDESNINDTINSNILARIPIDTEFCQYDAGTGREFFMNIQQKVIGNVRFFLTDNHNRPIGRPANSQSQTASGTGANQSTLGNLSFSMVLRIDVVQQRQVQELETAPVVSNVPKRFSNLLTHQGFGVDDYGRPIGR